jgi:putative transposase
MPEYRRIKEPGATYFFTVVTYSRQKILCLPESRDALRTAVEATRASYPFTIEAWVIQPDHIHCIWTMPESDFDYSKRWSIFKRKFTQRIKNTGIIKMTSDRVPSSRRKRMENPVWQRRFWEHMIRDQEDFNRHCDYIHYNPVKHGLVKNPGEWPHSTFRHFVKHGHYPEDWGATEPSSIVGLEIE